MFVCVCTVYSTYQESEHFDAIRDQDVRDIVIFFHILFCYSMIFFYVFFFTACTDGKYIRYRSAENSVY